MDGLRDKSRQYTKSMSALPANKMYSHQLRLIPPKTAQSPLLPRPGSYNDQNRKPPMTEMEKTRKKKQEQSVPKMSHNRPLPFQESITTFKIGPGSYSHSLDLIGNERSSDSRAGYGPLASRTERGLFQS